MNMLDYEKRKSEYIQKEAGLTQAEADKYFPLNNELTQKIRIACEAPGETQGNKENNNISMRSTASCSKTMLR